MLNWMHTFNSVYFRLEDTCVHPQAFEIFSPRLMYPYTSSVCIFKLIGVPFNGFGIEFQDGVLVCTICAYY